MSTIKAKNLSKVFEKPSRFSVIDDTSLEAKAGESIAIIGPSGVGKSTLLHLLGALDTPNSGTLEIAGQLVTPRNYSLIRNRHIGFIFQAFNLLDEYAALDNVLMPARIGRKTVSRERGMELLKRVDLEDRADFLVKLLSGGEKQRVAIARALCNEPDLILADEPTGNLDDDNSRMIHKLLIDCAKEYQKTLIVVTHNEEFAKLCDRVYLLKNGTLE